MAHNQRHEVRALRTTILALPLALAAACSRDPGSVVTTEPNTPPANFKTEILAYLRTYLNDPAGIRSASISEPELRTVPESSAQRYMVCLRFSAKNSNGKYEGSRDRMVAFLAGRLDTLVPARKEQCDKVNWKPFPELEKLRR